MQMPNTTTPRKRSAAKKVRAAKKRVTKSAKRAPATKAVKKTVKKTARKTRAATKTAKKTVAKATRSPATKRTTTSRPRNAAARTDAIALLKQDHREVAKLFARFERAGDGASRTKQRLVEEMIVALSRHAGIEELVFYPAVRREVARTDSDVLEALEEHHIVKILLHELEGVAPADERFDAKVTVMMESVRHHVKEEEQTLFPKVRARLGRTRLLDIGDELRAARSRVPTRPHPFSPDEPPANAIVGGAVAVIDRARTAGKKVVDRVWDEIPTP